jgi:serine protease inhibitor
MTLAAHGRLFGSRGAAGLAAIAVVGCGDAITGPAEPITELPRELSAAEVALVEAGNSFAVDLLREVYLASPDSTVFLSPLSASMALGMALNGAAGDTHDQMRGTLGLGSMTLGEINASYRDLIDLLRGLDPRVELGIGNAIFHRSSFQMEATFLDTVRTYFDARVEGLDFSDSSAADVINGWVREATHDRIDEIVEPPIDPLTMAFLINAIYFKGDWTTEFDPGDTYTGPFHLEDGGTADVRLMMKEDSLPYRTTDSWQAAELPYGGGAWTMTVAVPRVGYALADMVDDLDEILDPNAEWVRRPVEIHLPRFQLTWERVLNDDLKALGTVDAFDGRVADFTPMHAAALDAGLHLKSVKQKTFLKVDEIGTEAAAVTVIEVGVTSVGAGPPVLKADRPFLLAIRERLSGSVLFAGLIVEAPEEA